MCLTSGCDEAEARHTDLPSRCHLLHLTSLSLTSISGVWLAAAQGERVPVSHRGQRTAPRIRAAGDMEQDDSRVFERRHLIGRAIRPYAGHRCRHEPRVPRFCCSLRSVSPFISGMTETRSPTSCLHSPRAQPPPLRRGRRHRRQSRRQRVR